MGHPRVLTPEAVEALAAVQRARTAQLDTRAAAEAEARALIESRTRDTEAALGAAIREARALNVPHVRVMRDGLGTEDWRTVDRFAEIGA